MGHFICCWPTKCCQSLWLHDVIFTVYRHRDGTFCCLINCIERNDILIFLSHSQAGNNMGEVDCSLQPIKRKQKITKWVKIKSDNHHFLTNNLLGMISPCVCRGPPGWVSCTGARPLWRSRPWRCWCHCLSQCCARSRPAACCPASWRGRRWRWVEDLVN